MATWAPQSIELKKQKCTHQSVFFFLTCGVSGVYPRMISFKGNKTPWMSCIHPYRDPFFQLPDLHSFRLCKKTPWTQRQHANSPQNGLYKDIHIGKPWAESLLIKPLLSWRQLLRPPLSFAPVHLINFCLVHTNLFFFLQTCYSAPALELRPPASLGRLCPQDAPQFLH